jgi:hypothetical protein
MFLSDPHVLACLLITGTVAIGLILLQRYKKDGGPVAGLLKDTAWYYYIAILLLGLFVSQYVFYSGKWPTNMRYDFPGMLAVPLLFLAMVVFVRRLMAQRVPQTVDKCVLVLFSLFIIININWQGFSVLKAASRANAQTTQAFSQNMASLADKMKHNPTAGLVLESFRAGDYEPVASIGRFIRFYGVKNPVFLHINEHPGYARTSLDLELKKTMLSASKDGSAETYLRGSNFSPYIELAHVTKCFSVSLYANVDLHSGCEYLGQLY